MTRGLSDQSLGILLLLGAILTFTLMDATAKHLVGAYHPGQIVFVRLAINLTAVLALIGPRLRQVAATRQPLIQIGRGVAQLASVGLFFTALGSIGLAEATAIMDLNPVLITLFAALFLGERIGPRRLLGIGAALAGALLIIKPGASVFQPAALLPLMGAATYAAGAILTRMARGESTLTSMLWATGSATVLTALLMPFVWQPIAAQHLWAFAALGLFGTLSQALLIRAFALAEAAAIAPFGYTGLVWAGLWGWLFWGTIPDGWSILGAVVIVGAGLYVWQREARDMRKTGKR